jgi:acyl phosphate:glycerol-3-phosphate acyltransferase
MTHLQLAVAIYLSYLVGSLSSAIITCKCLGLPDPRTQGSGNPGATNVLRLGGKKAAFITLLGDGLKGAIPVWAAAYYGFDAAAIAFIAFAAFFGHLFPIFFGFRGGKGVATLLGSLIALSPLAGLAWIGTWLIIALIFRYSSLAALIASLLTPFYLWMLTHNKTFTFLYLLMSLMLLLTHRSNLRNLFTGKERKIAK